MHDSFALGLATGLMLMVMPVLAAWMAACFTGWRIAKALERAGLDVHLKGEVQG